MPSAVINSVTDSINRTSGPAHNALTLAFWMKVDSSIVDNVPANICFINSSYAYYVGIRMIFAALGGRLVITGGGITDPVNPDDPSIERNTWLYVAMTSAGAVTDGFKAYVWSADGVLQQTAFGTPTGSGTLDSIQIGNLDGDATLGKYAYGRVWSRVLTQANLEAEMFSPTVVGTTNIYSAWVDDPSTDVSGQSHPFSVTSITTDADTPPVTAPPAISGDYVLDFDGAANEDPWVETGWSRVAGTTALKLTDNPSTVLRATATDSLLRWYAYTGTPANASGIMEAKIELAGINSSDRFYVGVLDENGYGYVLVGNSSSGSWAYAAVVQAYVITGGIAGSIDFNPGVTLANGDIVSLRVEKTGGSNTTVTLRKNGTLFTTNGTFTNATGAGALGALRPIFGLKPENTNSTTIRAFAADGFGSNVLLTPRRQFFIHRRIIQH
jgi:hypothetical protein